MEAPRSPCGPFSLLPLDCFVSVMEHCSASDKSSLLRTSKGLHSSTEPFFYQEINLNWSTHVIPLQRILQLLRTILLQRPDLASAVQHVSILSSNPPTADFWVPTQDDMDWNREASLFADVVSAARRIIYLTQFSPGEEPEWVEFLERGMFHIFVAIFISRLHRLKTLRLDHSFVWLGGYLGRMVMHSLFSGEPDPVSMLSKFESLWLVDYG